MSRRIILTAASGLLLVFLLTAVSASAPDAAVVSAPLINADDPLDSIPYPRTYMFLHGPVYTTNASCISGDDKTKLLMERARFANVFEAQMEYSDVWKVDGNGDGDCVDTGDQALIPWLETQTQTLGRNRWGMAVPHYQLAFVPVWYYYGFTTGAPHRDDLSAKVGGTCVNQWPLRTVGNQIARWSSSLPNLPLYAINVYTNGNTCNIGGSNQKYVNWYPTWLESRIGGVAALDGIRLDLPGNMHSYFDPVTVNQDVDKTPVCADAYETLTGCDTIQTTYGRDHLNDIFREGNQYIFNKIHFNHPNWLIIGDDAWMPETGNGNDFTAPGFAAKADINGAMTENWTDDWNAGGNTRYGAWFNPVDGGKPRPDFAVAMRIWRDWRNGLGNNKSYVILSKYCSLAGQAECGQPHIAFREMRFSLAAAAMVGAYHSYTGITLPNAQTQGGLTPTWFDEYAVYPNNEAADTDIEKTEGIGWLGMPLSEMTAVESNGNPGDTISEAFLRADWRTYINGRAWVRYFDHGVVLLNPTNSNKSIGFRVVSAASTARKHIRGNSLLSTPSIMARILVTTPPCSCHPTKVSFSSKNETYSNIVLAESTMVNAAGDLEVGQARVWTCVGTPCDWQWTWSTYRDSNGTLLEVDLENTQMASAELNFNWPTGMNNSSIVEEAYLNVYINDWTSASPRVWNHALHAERAMRWHGRYPGRGWVVTPNLKDIVAQEVQSGANPILLYLEPGAFDIPFIFRAWDHSDHSFAPVLGIRYRNTGGSGQTENPTVVYQHGVNGYTGGEDTHIVSTTWEPPTPHDTFPTLYVRTNSTENEVFSSIIRFNGVSLPPGVEVTNAMLAVYFNGQSVNGGSIGVHVAGPYPDWLAPQTTWTHYRTNQNWQANGAKGVEDRGLYVSERVVNYTDVGKWLYFNVTDLVQEGVYEYVLYGLHRGTNKDIKLPSNEYWDATKRPKLMIWYE